MSGFITVSGFGQLLWTILDLWIIFAHPLKKTASSSFEGHNGLSNTKQYNIQQNFKMVQISLDK